MQVKERKIRSDKKTRVNPSFDQDTHDRLKRLSIACDLSKTKMAEEIVKLAVNNPSIIDHLQGRFQASDTFRIIPILKDGKVYFD